MALIFLAGPIEQRTPDECIGWRDDVIAELGDICIDPTRDIRCKPYQIKVDYRDAGLIAGDIVEQNFSDIRRCDLVLANLDNYSVPSRGTVMDVLYAYMWHKPVVAWSNWVEQDPYLHTFVTVSFPTLQECIGYAKHFLYGTDFRRAVKDPLDFWPSIAKVPN